MTDDDKLGSLQVAIVQMDGKMNTMLEVIKSGDREAQASIKLVTGTVDHLATIVQDLRKDNKESFGRVYDRLEDHTSDSAPHAASQLIKDIQKDISDLQSAKNRLWGVIGFCCFLGPAGTVAVVKALGG